MSDDATVSQRDILVSADEVEMITGYRRHAQQLEELKRQGFWRARRAPITGRVILERAHYEAVCAGATLHAPQTRLAREPTVFPIETSVRRSVTPGRDR